MADDELASVVSPRTFYGGDGTAFEMIADVFGELLHGSVAAVRLFAQRHQDDLVEIARELAAQQGLVVPGGAGIAIEGGCRVHEFSLLE